MGAALPRSGARLLAALAILGLALLAVPAPAGAAIPSAERNALKQFTERAFGGDPLVLFQHLLDDDRLTESELAELKKMLERRRKELRDA